MPEPLTLTAIGIAALSGLAGNRADHAFCSIGRALRATFVDGLRDPRNHDVARAVRRAQLLALRLCTVEYGRLDHGRWYEWRRIRAQRHIRALDHWIIGGLVADRTLDGDLAEIGELSAEEWSLRARTIETTIERVFLYPEPHAGPSAARQDELRRLAESWTLDEVSARLADPAERDRFRGVLIEGVPARKFPGWWQLFRNFMAEEVKANSRVHNILTQQKVAAVLELQTDLASAVGQLQEGMEGLGDAVTGMLADLRGAERELRGSARELHAATRRVEARLDRFTMEMDRLLPTLERMEAGIERGFAETERAHSAFERGQAEIQRLATETLKRLDSPLAPVAHAVWDFVTAAGGAPQVGRGEIAVNDDRTTDLVMRAADGVVTMYCCVEGAAGKLHLDHLADRAARSDHASVRLITPLPIADGLARYAATRGAIVVQSLRGLVFETLGLDAYAEAIEQLVSEHIADEWFVPPRFSANLDPELADPADRTIFTDLRGHLADWVESAEPVHVALLGEYGSGKTSFTLRWVREQLRELGRRPAAPLVVMMRAAHAPTVDGFAQILAEFGRRYGTALSDARVFEALRAAGRLLIVFDGLDELVVGRIADPYRALSTLTGSGAGSKLLVTSRASYFRAMSEESGAMSQIRVAGDLPPFRVVRLEPFDVTQVRTYITRRMPPDRAQRIQQLLFDTYGLPDLATRPVLLDMLLSTWDRIEEERARDPTRPIQVGDLYRLYTDQWFTGTSSGRGGILSREQRARLMVEIAVWMADNGTQEMEVDALPARIAECLGEAFGRVAEIEREVRTQNFLVRSAQDRYHFAHRSFQEYFLAQEVAREIDTGMPRLLARTTLQPEVVAFTTAHDVDTARAWDLLETRRCEDDAAILNGNLLSVLRACRVDFSGRDLRGLVAEGAVLRGARFVGAQLAGCRLHGCDLQDTDFSNAVLKGATLTRLILGVRSPAKCVRFRPGYREVLTSDGGTSVRLLTIGSGAAPQEVHSHEDSVTCIAVSHDGRVVASGGFDGRVRVTDLLDGSTGTATTHGAIVYGVALHASGRYIASTDATGRLKVWDRQEDQLVGDWLEHRETAYTVDWSRTGDALVTGSFDGTVCLWRFATDGHLRLLERPLHLRDHEDLVNGVRFSPCGRFIAAASNNGTVRVWSVDDGELLAALAGQELAGGIEWAVAFAPAGDALASAGSDGTIRVRNWPGAVQRAAWKAHDAEIWTLDFDETGELLASGSLDGSVVVWPADGGVEIERWRFTASGHGLRVKDADFSEVRGLSELQRRVLLKLGAKN